MHNLLPTLLPCLAVWVLSTSCSLRHPPPPCSHVHANMVYDIVEHNDSIYFSTASQGIYRFHRGAPQRIHLVARLGGAPFRAIAFGSDGHDVAVDGDRIIVAHGHGIGVYDRTTGTPIRSYCSGVNFWCVDIYDSLVVAGGKNALAVIDDERCTEVTFGPQGNIAWATAVAAGQTVYAGTQKGLFRWRAGDREAVCVADMGRCIKALLVDTSGRLWAGRYE